MNLEELKSSIREAGIVGAGGAGFPTEVKLKEGIHTVILNGAECEPLLRVDRQLLTAYTKEILTALSLVVEVLDAKEGIIATKESYKEAQTAVRKDLGEYRRLSLKPIPEVYPAGDELLLIYTATGRIVPEGAVPASVGTIVLNVETCLNIYHAVFQQASVTEKYVTVTGAVKEPFTCKVPVGTPIDALIKAAGGTLGKDVEILQGGVMTGRMVDVLAPVTKTTKAIIVLPKEHPAICKKQIDVRTALRRAGAACSQCRMCTDLCPRYLLGHAIQPHKIMLAASNSLGGSIEELTAAMLCSDCGLCEMFACHQSLSPRKVTQELKNRLREKGIPNTHQAAPVKTRETREGRMVPMERLIQRLGITAYDKEAPLTKERLKPERVELLLQQHIGAAAVPVVKTGDKVKPGEVVAEIPAGKLGAKLHASIEGIITFTGKKSIIIERSSESAWKNL